MQMSIGLDRLKRFVCLLLIFVLLFCFFMCPRASAVAVEAATVAYAGALVGTILVGAGVIFSSHGDMQKVGTAMYKSWIKSSNAIGSKISAIAAWAVEHGEAAAKGALRVGEDLWQNIVQTFKSFYYDGSFSVSDVSSLDWDGDYDKLADWFDSVSFKSKDFAVYDSSGALWELQAYWYHGSWYGKLSRNGVEVNDKKMPEAYWNLSDALVTSGIYLYHPFNDSPEVWFRLALRVPSGGSDVSVFTYDLPAQSDTDFQLVSGNTLSSTIGASIPVTAPSDLAYPSDNTLVRMPDIPSVDTDTGETVFPSDAAYTKDAVSVPYPTDADGVKVPDIPYDKVVDQSTGKALDDTGTDTDNPSKPGEGTDTDKPSVNWPSAGDISLPKLIISKFPFCIPFDVARLIGLLEADPKTPIFHVPLKVGTILDEEIVLDLSQWDNAVRIIRWGELIVFVAGLVLVTRNYIKW